MLTTSAVTAARERGGIVRSDDLRTHPSREARRHSLVPVQKQVWAAATQPMAVPQILASVAARLETIEGDWAFSGRTALWLQGVASEPCVVTASVLRTHRLDVLPPATRDRVRPDVLANRLTRNGHPVVRLEIGVVQALAGPVDEQGVRLVEDVLRQRRTTADRLRSAQARGRSGSARLGMVLALLGAGDLEIRQRRLRAALEREGVRDLQPEVHVVSRDGASAYLDLLHRPSRRAVEVDGAATHGTRAQQQVDRRRDRWVLRDHGIETLRVTVGEIDQGLTRTARELAEMLRLPR